VYKDGKITTVVYNEQQFYGLLIQDNPG